MNDLITKRVVLVSRKTAQHKDKLYKCLLNTRISIKFNFISLFLLKIFKIENVEKDILTEMRSVDLKFNKYSL